MSEKRYELSNHLGNVLAVITDRRFATEDAGATGNVKYYEPDVVAAQDYDPFGMLLTGRIWEAGSGYRYGFNSQEQDDEVYGNGNFNTAEFWGYDTRLGRRFNTDPVSKAYISNYATFSCNPIVRIDIHGDDDYFDTYGNYLGTDRNGTHLIKVISNETLKGLVYINQGQKTIDQSSVLEWSLLSDFTYNNENPSNSYNEYRLGKITTHYTGKKYTLKEYSNKRSPASTSNQDGSISIHTFNGKINSDLNNYMLLKSVLIDHEKLHKIDFEDGVPLTFERHANIYLNQFKQTRFGLINDESLEVGYIASGVDYAINSHFKQNTMSLADWQTKFNNALTEGGSKYSVEIYDSNRIKNTMYYIHNTETGLKYPFFATDKESTK